jgi:uncharacterized cupin superfamily protein
MIAGERVAQNRRIRPSLTCKQLHSENAMSKSIVMANAATAELEPAPISPDWVLHGTPETRSKELARSRDLTSYVMVWDCTAGRFNWHYSKDETLVVISGEAFITNEKGEERRLGPGDIVFFPAGSSSTWRVPSYIKKVAFLRHTMPRPLGFGVLAWNKLLQIVGWRVHGPLAVNAAVLLNPENWLAN